MRLLCYCEAVGRGRGRAVRTVQCSQAGLVVTDVPKVPIWKVIDFNVLRRGMCGNSLISGKSQLLSAQHEVFGDRGRLAKQV